MYSLYFDTSKQLQMQLLSYQTSFVHHGVLKAHMFYTYYHGMKEGSICLFDAGSLE